MKILDAHQLPSTTTVNADICIVGSGAAGITLASELDGTAGTVCLVEGGGYQPDEDTQALYDLSVAGQPVRENFMSRARYFGGTCNIWSGRTMRMIPLDFERREWVPNSGWPIPYTEIERYYTKAESILGLPGSGAFSPSETGSSLSPVDRRLLDSPDLQPAIALWGRRPFRFGRAYRRQLEASRNVSVYLNANVTDIRLNPEGNRVKSCTALSLSGKTLHLTANRFVLACGGLETARLLLASRSVQSDGIGNQFGIVGRYYMDHPRAVFGRVTFSQPQKLQCVLGTPLRGGMAQVGIQLSEAAQRRERLLNNYVTLERHWSDQTARSYQSFVRTMKILLRKGYAGRRFSVAAASLAKVPELIYQLPPRELMPHSVYSVARRLRQRLSGVTDLVLVNYCEQIPTPTSRVYLGTDRDRLNMPRLVLNWVIGREETESLMRLHALLDQHLRRHQIGCVDHQGQEFSDRLYTDASHHLGTARMSSDPRHGVVDEHCKVHGIDNLFIAGSAVFPTAGYANPTLTIVALAVRLSEHLKRIAARTEVRR